MLQIDKHSIVTITNTESNYKAVYTGKWFPRGKDMFYQVIPLTAQRNVSPRDVSEKIITNIAPFPAFEIDERVNLTDMKGTVEAIETDHIKIKKDYSRSMRYKGNKLFDTRRNEGGICSILKYRLLTLNPNKVL